MPTKDIIEVLTLAQIDSLRKINTLNPEDFRNLVEKSLIASEEKVLLYDILSLFNSMEVNLNSVVGLEGDGDKCGNLSVFINETNLKENPTYKNLFTTEMELNNIGVVRDYIEVRHLIAHSLVRKHKGTDSLVFFTTNRKDWRNKVKNRQKNLEKFTNRVDSETILSELPSNHASYAVLTLDFLRFLRTILIPIEIQIAKFAQKKTSKCKV